jgi:hypothetical protein
VHENLNEIHILLLRIFLAQAACADWSEKIGKMYLVPVCSAGAGAPPVMDLHPHVTISNDTGN